MDTLVYSIETYDLKPTSKPNRKIAAAARRVVRTVKQTDTFANRIVTHESRATT